MAEYTIGASIDQIEKKEDLFSQQDPFSRSWDDLKSLAGLDNNFKRRATRMSKQAGSMTSYPPTSTPYSTDPTDRYMSSAKAIAQGHDGARSK
jgi:hypothetical protein